MICFASITSTLPGLLLVVAFCVGLTLAMRRDKRVFSPASRKKMNRLLFPLWLAVTAVFVFEAMHKGKPLPWNLSLFALLGLISGYEAFFRQSTPNEDRQNWACDPMHCGRCGYDLTGNVSGVCPECGMSIPHSRAEIQSPRWGAWWLQWRIDYLDDWKRTLATVAGFAVVFAVLAVWMAFGKSSANPLALLPGLVCVNMVINCVRIVQYRQRTRT